MSHREESPSAASALRQRADGLAEKARGLEPDAPQRDRWLSAVADYAEDWLRSLPNLPGYVFDGPESAEALAARPIGAAPAAIEDVLETLAA
ncbi:MAG: hypothetical protein AAFN74_20015, partial [Myxococcota bacterium]